MLSLKYCSSCSPSVVLKKLVLLPCFKKKPIFCQSTFLKVVSASIHMCVQFIHEYRCYKVKFPVVAIEVFYVTTQMQYVHFEPGCKAEEMAVRQTALPVLRSREVLVKNFATTINRADTLQVRVGCSRRLLFYCSIWSNN